MLYPLYIGISPIDIDPIGSPVRDDLLGNSTARAVWDHQDCTCCKWSAVTGRSDSHFGVLFDVLSTSGWLSLSLSKN